MATVTKQLEDKSTQSIWNPEDIPSLNLTKNSDGNLSIIKKKEQEFNDTYPYSQLDSISFMMNNAKNDIKLQQN